MIRHRYRTSRPVTCAVTYRGTIASGEEATLEFLKGLVANDAQIFPNNVEILDAIARGEIEIGLVNHYYGAQRLAEEPDAPIANHLFEAGDPGTLVSVAGAGVLSTTDQEDDAEAFVEFLLSDETQQYFADETAEYPVVAGITSTEHDLVPLDELDTHQIDLNELDSLDETLALLDEVGLT